MKTRQLLALLALATSCSAGPLDGQARSVGLNAEGLHLDVMATPGVVLEVAGTSTPLPSGKGRIVVPVAALPTGASSLGLTLRRTHHLFFTDKATLTASIPFDPKLAATLPKPEDGTWIRWLRAEGGTTSRAGTLREGERKLPVRLDDEGECQLEFASSKGLQLELPDGVVQANAELGGGRVACSRLFASATYELTKDASGEWLDITVPLATRAGRATATRFSIDRQLIEEHLQKRINLLIAQKRPLPGAPVGAKRAVLRLADGKLRFLGPPTAIGVVAVATLQPERAAPECTKFKITAKLETNTKPPKSLARVFIDQEVKLYDRAGKQLDTAIFPGGASGCPTEVTQRQAREKIKDGADPAAVESWVVKHLDH